MDKVRVYTCYDRPPAAAMDKFGKSRTRQADAKDCDINAIMARYEKTGVLPVTQRQALYVDVSEMGDYRTALHQVAEAEGLFMQLPAHVREQFANDPAVFLDFCSDEANQEAMVELGLLDAVERPVKADEAGKASDPGSKPGESQK